MLPKFSIHEVLKISLIDMFSMLEIFWYIWSRNKKLQELGHCMKTRNSEEKKKKGEKD